MAKLNCIVYRCAGHKTTEQSKKIVIKESQNSCSLWERVGEKGILIGKQNQNESLCGWQVGIFFRGDGNIVSWTGHWLCGCQLHYCLVNDIQIYTIYAAFTYILQKVFFTILKTVMTHNIVLTLNWWADWSLENQVGQCY